MNLARRLCKQAATLGMAATMIATPVIARAENVSISDTPSDSSIQANFNMDEYVISDIGYGLLLSIPVSFDLTYQSSTKTFDGTTSPLYAAGKLADKTVVQVTLGDQIPVSDSKGVELTKLDTTVVPSSGVQSTIDFTESSLETVPADKIAKWLPTETFLNADNAVLGKLVSSGEYKTVSILAKLGARDIFRAGAKNTAETYHATVPMTIEIAQNNIVDISALTYAADDSTQTMSLSKIDASVTDAAIPSTYTVNGNKYTVTAIGEDFAYNNTTLQSISIPATVKTLNAWAFRGATALKDVTLAEGVATIGDRAFMGSAVENINFPSTITKIDYMAFAYTHVKIVDLSKCAIKSFGTRAFDGCSSMTSIKLPKSMTNITGLSGCSGLQTVELPSSTLSIDSQAFLGCDALQSLTLPEGATSIGIQAFQNCTSLTSITLPSTFTTIDDQAFWGCTKLTDIYYNGTIAQYGSVSVASDAFTRMNSKPTIHCTDGDIAP